MPKKLYGVPSEQPNDIGGASPAGAIALTRMIMDLLGHREALGHGLPDTNHMIHGLGIQSGGNRQDYVNPDPMAPKPDSTLPYINGTASGDPMSSQQSTVEELLRLIEPATAPPPYNPGIGRSIMGGLGDALIAAAQAKVGNPSGQTGPFASNLMRQREQDRMMAAGATEENRRTRNNIRIGAFEENQRRQREIDVEKLRGQNRIDAKRLIGKRLIPQTATENIDGVPKTITRFYDPETGDLISQHVGDERGFAPSIFPGLEVDTQTGEVRPTFVRVPKVGGYGPINIGSGGGKTIQPLPAEGSINNIAADAASLQGTDEALNAWRDIHTIAMKGDEDSLANAVVSWGKLRGVENFDVLSTQFPEYANYLSKTWAAINVYIKQQTGAQFSVQEMERYVSMFPKPWSPESVAKTKIEALQQRALSDMQARIAANPALAGPAAAGRKNPGGAKPNSGPATGKSLPASAFNSLPPGKREAEKARFRADGGTIVEGQ